jgi:hypothetical protein
MVPFIVRGDDGRYLVSGHTSVAEIDDSQFLALLSNTAGVLDVADAGAELPVFDRTLVAGWLGDRFLEACAELGASSPDVPDTRFVAAGRGSFWIGPSAEVYGCLARWTEAAARQAIRDKDEKLADLMAWALPLAPETVAATWWTRTTGESRHSYLEWQARLIAGNGRRKPEDIKIECQRIVGRFLEMELS